MRGENNFTFSLQYARLRTKDKTVKTTWNFRRFQGWAKSSGFDNLNKFRTVVSEVSSLVGNPLSHFYKRQLKYLYNVVFKIIKWLLPLNTHNMITEAVLFIPSY